MKRKITEFLLLDEDVSLKEVSIVMIGSVLLFPIGYFIVFAPMGWWMK